MVIFSVLISMVDSTVASPPSTLIGAFIYDKTVEFNFPEYYFFKQQICFILLPGQFGWCWMLEPSRI
jgi:hypothetical protein